DWAEVAREISRLARQVAGEVTDRPVARGVVKVRYAPFVTVTHGAPLAPGTQSPPGIPQPHGEPDPLSEPSVLAPPGRDDPAAESEAANPPDSAAADATWAAIIE